MKQEIAPAAYSTCDAARYLRISRAQLYRWFASGTLGYAKIGGRTLVRRVDMDALLERSLVPAKAPAP